MDIMLKLPEHFLEEEDRSGYHISTLLKKVWAVELDLLYILDNVCKKYNITYWVDGGTILGAVRHGGFIPWDDDIDIIMYRRDYNKLCSIIIDELKEPYFFQTEYTDPGSCRGHAQLRNSNTTGILKSELPFKYSFNQGIFIDIFPLDYIPDGNTEEKKYIKNIERLTGKAQRYSLYTYSYMPSKRNILKKVLNKTLLRTLHYIHGTDLLPNPYFVEFEKLVKSSDMSPTKKLGKLFRNPVQERSIWNTEWFDSTIYIQFEMLTVPIPSGYEKILNKFFGEWRTPKKMNSTHGNVLFDVDKSYTYYSGGGVQLK